jgi:hypothetical protein
MSTTPPLSLQDIVDLTVQVAPSAASANSFNQGLIVGSSTHIPSYGANARLRKYASTTAMQSDGFLNTDPELISAQLYFSPTPAAAFVWIGRQDLTAIQSLIPHSGAGGTGYVVGDIVNIVQGGASHGQATVTAVTGGAVTALVANIIGGQGTGYSVAASLSTTGGTGTGLQVDITAIGESLLQATEACRIASNAFYGVMVCNPVDADNLALAEWADPLWMSTRYYGWSNDAAIPAGTANNLFLQIQTLALRVLMTYATNQGGLFPNNVYAAAAVMGVEMGLQTGLANSFFTSAHKVLPGVAPEQLTETQFTNIKSAGGNVYCNFAPFKLYEPGIMSNGAPSYLWLYLAILVNNMQINEMNVLQSTPAVPQTNAGEHLLIQAAQQACALLATIGFLSGGTWEGLSFNIPGVQVTNGQAIPLGYLVLAQPYSQQLDSDRAAGRAMPLYVFIITSGATLSLVIGVYTQL